MEEVHSWEEEQVDPGNYLMLVKGKGSRRWDFSGEHSGDEKCLIASLRFP